MVAICTTARPINGCDAINDDAVRARSMTEKMKNGDLRAPLIYRQRAPNFGAYVELKGNDRICNGVGLVPMVAAV